MKRKMKVRYDIVPDGEAWAVLQIGMRTDRKVSPHLKRLLAHGITLGDAIALVEFLRFCDIKHVANWQ